MCDVCIVFAVHKLIFHVIYFSLCESIISCFSFMDPLLLLWESCVKGSNLFVWVCGLGRSTVLSWVEVTVCGHCLVTVCGRSLQAHIGMGIRPTLSWPVVATAYYFPTHPPPFFFLFFFFFVTLLGRGSHDGTQICSCKCVLSGPFCFTSTEARCIRVGDRAVSPRHCPANNAPRNCCFNCRAWAESQGQCPLHRCWATTRSERSPTFAAQRRPPPYSSVISSG